MAEKIDSFPGKNEKKETVNEQESERDDEKYGLGARYWNEKNIKSNDWRINNSHGKTDTSLVHAQDKRQQDPDMFPCYYYREPIRGSAVFVVNQRFQHDYRKGAEMDLSYLKFMFLDKLGFEQLNKGNDFDLKLSKLDDILGKATSKDYSDTDFFVFAISTHGEERPRQSEHFEHALMCTDGQYKFTMDIIDSFSRCPTLAGKPKIFVIQACRSPYGSNEKGPEIVDKGLEFKLTHKKEERWSETKGYYNADDKADAKNEADAKNKANSNDEADPKTDTKDEACAKADKKNKTNAKDDTDAMLNEKDEAGTEQMSDDYQKGRPDLGSGRKTFNLQKDCLVVYAIQSGMGAWRHEETGSWLLYELNEMMKEYTYPCKIPFLHILTTTAFKMAQRESSEGDTLPAGLKAVSVFQHTLTKDLLLPVTNRQT